MKKLQWIPAMTASAALMMILLITSFEVILYTDFDIYQKEYEKYNVLSELDMEMDDVMYVTHEMMEYLRGNRQELSVTTIVEGREQDFFNEQDRLHMKDVRDLFIGGLHVRTGSFLILLLSLILLAVFKADLRRILSKSYQIMLGILAILILLLGISIVVDFSTVFTIFHKLFFDNDLWLFDPAQDYMIRMLPERLFYDMVIRIGGVFVVSLMVLQILSVIFGRKKISTAY